MIRSATPGSITYTANALNQYTGFGGTASPTYDGNGNLTFDGSTTFSYDADNRLLSMTQAADPTTATNAYTYDAQGRRKT